MTRRTVGEQLRAWREVRHLSQLDLALAAGSSARHLSYLETGKARPSPEMIHRLAEALDVPLRDRNVLLLAAGFAPRYPETSFAAMEPGPVRQAIERILDHQNPYPAFLLNRRWDILMANESAARVSRLVMGGRPQRHDNMIRQFLDPEDLRGAVDNWTEVADDLIRHLRAEAAWTPDDTGLAALVTEALGYPGVPSSWLSWSDREPTTPVLTVHFRSPRGPLRFFSTLTIFGTPRDIGLDELRIESVFPADDATAAACRTLATNTGESSR
ncbi:MAG: helix-turn-helix domain-containing protein [Gemmatimonadales bacterium]